MTLTQSMLSGQLDFRGGAVVNASAYEGQMTADLNKDAWATVGVFTASRFSLDDVKPGTTYWARERAIGSAGPRGVDRCNVGDRDLIRKSTRVSPGRRRRAFLRTLPRVLPVKSAESAESGALA